MATQGLFIDPQQLQQAQDLAAAQLTPEQRLYMMGRGTGRAIGQGLGGFFGVDVQDPAMARASKLRELGAKYGTTTAEALDKIAADLQQTDPQMAMQVAQKAQELRTSTAKLQSEQALTQQRLREKQGADPFQQFLRSAGDKYTPESLAAFQQSGNPADLVRIEKPEAKQPTSEFERLVDSLPISDAEKSRMKAQRATALASGDSSGMKGLQAELVQARLDALRTETKQKEEKATEDKRMAISKLSDVESSVDTAVATAEKALKLAPGTMLQATTQSLFSNVPFTDAKSMKNLVSALNSEKAIGTLEQLKSQSRTGATGFGALTAPELQLILDKTRSLDPTDKMFKENLAIVVDGWKKIKSTSTESRIGLQGKGDKLNTLKSKIATVKARGSITPDEKAEIEALKRELGVN